MVWNLNYFQPRASEMGIGTELKLFSLHRLSYENEISRSKVSTVKVTIICIFLL